MDLIDKMCNLLEAMKERFQEYEQATLALMDCSADDAEHYITQRGKLATEIDGIDDEIKALCGQAPDPADLLAAAKASVPFERVPSAYQPVYYAGQAVRSVMHRISQSEQSAMARLERLREEALEGVKQNQNMPKIKKYLTGLTDGPAQPLTDNKA